MMYSVESERQALVKGKASSSAHRSAASAIASLFVGLMIVRVGLLQFWSAGQQGDNEWLEGLPRMVAETGVLLDVSERIEQVLVPFGSGSSTEMEKIAWADELMAEQERLESRMIGSRFTHNRPAKFKGVTAWGRELMKLQDRFKERMEKLLPASVHALLMPTSSESQSNMPSTPLGNQKDESVKRTSAQEDMHWAQDVPGALQAEIEHTKRTLEFEFRKVARQQSRLEKQKFAKTTEDSFANFFQARKKAQAQRRKEQAWARGLPGASQACGEHEQRMQELESRKLARQQHRSETNSFAQATKDGFAEFLQERKVAQATMRKSKKWAQNLPGESQSYANHEQRLKEFQARKEARQQHRLEKRILAQETKDGFAKFFQARKDAHTQFRKSSSY